MLRRALKPPSRDDARLKSLYGLPAGVLGLASTQDWFFTGVVTLPQSTVNSWESTLVLWKLRAPVLGLRLSIASHFGTSKDATFKKMFTLFSYIALLTGALIFTLVINIGLLKFARLI
jgi:hypothetical protein